MFYQLTTLLKVQQSAILNLPLEIKDHIQDALVHMQQSLDTLMMVQEPELDCHQVQEKLFLEVAELLLELLLVEFGLMRHGVLIGVGIQKKHGL